MLKSPREILLDEELGSYPEGGPPPDQNQPISCWFNTEATTLKNEKVEPEG
jgi:hypothetical protein